jgi:hypothetical protein
MLTSPSACFPSSCVPDVRPQYHVNLTECLFPLQLCERCPATEQVAMQRLLEQHRQDLDGLEQEMALEKSRQMSDVQVGAINRLVGAINRLVGAINRLVGGYK